MKAIKTKSFPYANLSLYDNGVFHVHVLSKTPLNISHSIEINEFRNQVMNNKKALVLSTSEDLFVVPNKETIEYLISPERLNYIKANAYVIKSFSQRLAFKAIRDLKNITTPIAYFATKEEAIEWLVNFKD